jgi:hypothetical protein
LEAKQKPKPPETRQRAILVAKTKQKPKPQAVQEGDADDASGPRRRSHDDSQGPPKRTRSVEQAEDEMSNGASAGSQGHTEADDWEGFVDEALAPDGNPHLHPDDPLALEADWLQIGCDDNQYVYLRKMCGLGIHNGNGRPAAENGSSCGKCVDRESNTATANRRKRYGALPHFRQNIRKNDGNEATPESTTETTNRRK